MANLVKYSTLLTHLENRILSVKESKKISLASDEEFKKAIYWAVTLLGITQTPDEGQKIILIASIKNHWPEITLNQFVQAFDMVSHFDLKNIPDHYNSFNSMYVNKVLQAYTDKLNLIKRKLLNIEKTTMPKTDYTKPMPHLIPSKESGNLKVNEVCKRMK